MKLGRRLCTELTRRVVERTPVDTGEARGGWNPAINTIDFTADGALDKTGAGVIAEAQRVVATMQAGDEYSCANSVGHISVLEYGWSKQAPAGMLRVTIAEAPSIWREIVSGRL